VTMVTLISIILELFRFELIVREKLYELTLTILTARTP
jgi:hypothetical protein